MLAYNFANRPKHGSRSRAINFNDKATQAPITPIFIIFASKVFPAGTVVNAKAEPTMQMKTREINATSLEKARALFESKAINRIEIGTVQGLYNIHAAHFGGLYVTHRLWNCMRY